MKIELGLDKTALGKLGKSALLAAVGAATAIALDGLGAIEVNGTWGPLIVGAITVGLNALRKWLLATGQP